MAQTSLDVLTIEFSQYYESPWRIIVYAIPIENLKAIKDSLISEFFSQIENWFRKRTDAKIPARHSLSICFDDNQLVLKEWDRA